MAWITLVLQSFKFFGFFIDLYKEKDKKKAEEKAIIGKDIVNAYKETDPKIRASRINAVSDAIDRVR
jgi:hypothetical protein